MRNPAGQDWDRGMATDEGGLPGASQTSSVEPLLAPILPASLHPDLLSQTHLKPQGLPEGSQAEAALPAS